MDSVTKTCNGLEMKLSPKSSLARCLCLMTHSCRIEESKPKGEEDDDLNKNMSEVPLVFGPLCSFMDRDDQVDLELSCLSNMSVTVVFVPDIGIHPVHFISFHSFLVYKKTRRTTSMPSLLSMVLPFWTRLTPCQSSNLGIFGLHPSS